MNKRKAKICTALLGIIMLALYMAIIFIENNEGTTLYEFLRMVFFPVFVGHSMSKCVIRFYEWLIKAD
jgi:hypothetical protein